MSHRSSMLVAEETVNSLKRLFHVVNKQSKNVAADSGLSGSQLWALKVLSEEPDSAMTVSDLARRMHVNASTVVRILDVLEIKGYVQRIRSLNDRRIVQVSLTEQGVSLVDRSPEIAHGMLVNGLCMLSENKLNSIASGLSQLLTILEARSGPGAGMSEGKRGTPKKSIR
ncbi:MarR family winged helix-turn-helix transcriptional regulator [Trichlorobacter ammonificans]|uniref:MarR family transcriptional regulator n=1 Tax=Trichlorobacter ammonificans TaxID=2916410 RepID=A0ABM9D8Z8_9BACT|nr:MarR family transcriptional regulator [Trichlorobacter ammonificans]CAH2031697.1 MarR family transcriptional regulator [Trichlorobacter ammonificans]